jgi:molybdate transport system ATP-binding protein
MLATIKPEGLSALNILAGIVLQLAPAYDGSVEVQLDCGGDIILSRITALSVEKLAITPGKRLYAVIKTVALQP